MCFSREELYTRGVWSTRVWRSRTDGEAAWIPPALKAMDARAIEVDETSPSPSHGSARSGTFDAIPSDVLACILLRLDPPSLRALELCCRRFKDLIKERNVWKQLCFLRYGSLRYHAVRFVDEVAELLGEHVKGGRLQRFRRRVWILAQRGLQKRPWRRC